MGEATMPFRDLRLAMMLVAVVCLPGCGSREVKGYLPPTQSWPTPEPQQVVAPPAAIPQIPLDIPAAIATDPEAQRFHALRRLVETGLAAADDALARRTENLGSLLPYSAPPPAAGLARPAPLQNIADQLARLATRPPEIAEETSAQRGFLMENLLPREPRSRALPARIDAPALKMGRDRVDTLTRLGLVTPEERMTELAAIGQNEQVLAKAPPPPPPAKKKPTRKKPPVGSGGGAKPGDVPGGAIPPKGAGPVGVHLLSMASDTMTAKAVDALKKEYPELAALEFKAVKTEIPDLGTTYRLLAGPMPKDEAEKLCVALRAKAQSCAVASY
jgi:hypothetical protein